MDFSFFDTTIETLEAIFSNLWGLISNNIIIMVLFYSSVADLAIGIFISIVKGRNKDG